ncbi:hypothetical protein JKP88DRAFT_260809 [Tribonema minus]|uniref:DNA replication complex GINS protein SLD5 n=1 Tax=Tribonema minus TaxID=303371 RepID=A0A836CPL9_9STRA|nr:hypothetical protein JKP88DRAFT_260809 [Tribonema minus]
MSDFEDQGYLDEHLSPPGSPIRSEDEQEEETAPPVQRQALPDAVVELQNAWVGEVCAPELLVYRDEIIDKMLEQLTSVQAILDDYKSSGPDEMYTASLYQMELNRIRFGVTKYLRTRVHKIERDVFYILSNTKEMLSSGRLSDHSRLYCHHVVILAQQRYCTEQRQSSRALRAGEVICIWCSYIARELTYAKVYCDLLHGHLQSTVLDHLPDAYADIRSQAGGAQIIAEPDLDVFVVCRVVEDVGVVEISAEQNSQIELRAGDEYVMRYRPIRDFVLDGSIELI